MSGTPAPRAATWSSRNAPAGTEGLTEPQLTAPVTREGLIGTAAV